jgi:solute carrier family 25 aspartate/glutamate transporter 12/13
MEASIIFHFAGRGDGRQRLSLLDFGQLLDPRWQPPAEFSRPTPKAKSILETVGKSAYHFFLGEKFAQMTRYELNGCIGGVAGAFGAFMVYPIDLSESIF